jgi:cytochrome b subunit of formate dehydrogenase
MATSDRDPSEAQFQPQPRPSEADALIRDDEVFVRMTLSERLQHLALIICFVTLILTGLPLLFDPVTWLRKVFFFETSFAWRGILHRAAGVGLIVLSVFHLIYVIFTRRGREIFRALMPGVKDVTDAFESFAYNLGLSAWLCRKGYLRKFLNNHPYWLFDRPPEFGRYNFVEKLEYMALLWGNSIMIVTGIFLWATNLSLRLLPMWVYDIFKIVHSYEAILAFLAVIIWHLYNVHLVLESKAWIDGKITGEEMRRFHPLEYRAILERRKNPGTQGPG